MRLRQTDGVRNTPLGSPSSSPISDAIRRRLTKIKSDALELNHEPRCRTPFLLREREVLPPFEKSELDNPELLISAAAEIYRMRRARDRVLPQELRNEVAWDILLVLYAEQPQKVPVSSVCYASGAPVTTALRWCGALKRLDLVDRTQHGGDGRSVLLSLTDKGRLIMARALQAMLRAPPH